MAFQKEKLMADLKDEQREKLSVAWMVVMMALLKVNLMAVLWVD